MRDLGRVLRYVGAAAGVVLATACGKEGCGLECPRVESVNVGPGTGVALVVGRTVTLLATVKAFGSADAAVRWTSSNPGVATVDGSGLVRGVAVGGPVAITATSVYDATKSASTQVVVTLDSAAIALALAPQALSVRQGASGTSSITVTRGPGYSEAIALATANLPNGIKAAFSPANIAEGQTGSTLTVTVDPALPPGPYTLNVTAGSPTAVMKGQTVTVTVTARVASVKATVADTAILVGQNTRATAVLRGLRDTVLTGRAVKWESTNATIASVNSEDGLVTGLAEGVAFIRATAEGVGDSARVTVSRDSTPAITMASYSAVQRVGYVRDTLSRPATAVWGTDAQNFVVASGGQVWSYRGGAPSGSYPLSTNVAEDISLSGTGFDNLYAVASSLQRIARYNGTAWTPLTNPVTGRALGDVWVGASGGIAVGDGGTILRLVGATVSPMTSGTTSNLTAAWGFGDSTMFAGGSNGVLLRWDGKGWSSIAGLPTSETVTDLWGPSATQLYVGTQSGLIYRWTAGLSALSSFNALATAGERGVLLAGRSESEVYAVGASGGSQSLWSLSGSTWTRAAVSPVVPSQYTSIHMAGPDLILGASRAGGVFVRPGGTGALTRLLLNPEHFSVWVAPVSGRAFIGSESGRLLMYDGTTLEVAAADPSIRAPLRGVWGVSEGEVHVVGDDFIGRYDGGVLKSVMSTTADFQAVHGSAQNNVVGVGSAIYRYDGTQWQDQRVTGITQLTDVWVVSPTFAAAVGRTAQGQLLRFDGTRWQGETLPVNAAQALSVYAASPSAIFVGLSDGRILRSTAGGWVADQVAPTTCNVFDLWGAGPNEVYAVSMSCGRVYRWNGKTWVLALTTGAQAGLRGISGRAGLGGWAVGSASTVVRGSPGKP
jgi:hypothetical protein